MWLNKTSSVGLVLTLDDKSYLDYLCVTWLWVRKKNWAGIDRSLT